MPPVRPATIADSSRRSRSRWLRGFDEFLRPGDPDDEGDETVVLRVWSLILALLCPFGLVSSSSFTPECFESLRLLLRVRRLEEDASRNVLNG